MAILTKQQILDIPISELIECKALAKEAMKASEYYKNIEMFFDSNFNQEI